MSKKKIIPAHFRLAFSGNLKLRTAAQVENIMFALEDMDAAHLEAPFSVRQLPHAIPEAIRKLLVAKSKQLVTFQHEINAMLSELYEIAETVMDEMDRAAEAQKPHCKACGQVVKPAKRSK